KNSLTSMEPIHPLMRLGKDLQKSINYEIDDIKPSPIQLAKSSPACSIPALALSESFSCVKKLFLN
ncbi:hypothetical protein, partial [Bartonella sp. AA78NXGY]|uniref:hypothetical protein n=1 Tax=Bartonella sp. AA78NXGY TaxID=3243437 RepID=UPI0035CFE123